MSISQARCGVLSIVILMTGLGGCAAAFNGAALEQEAAALRLENQRLLQEVAELREDVATARQEREEMSRKVAELQAELDRARGVRR